MNQATRLIPIAEEGLVTGQVKIPQAMPAGFRGGGQQGRTAFVDPIEFEQTTTPGDKPVHWSFRTGAQLSIRLGSLLPSLHLLQDYRPQLERLGAVSVGGRQGV